MKITKLYPQFKSKALVLSYDDGVEQDVRLVKLLNKYDLKGTFNLNSQLSRQQFVWTHECGQPIRRLPLQAVSKLYSGHEVTSHSLTHPYMIGLTKQELRRQMLDDKQNLEKVLNKPVVGFAVPFDVCDEAVCKCAPDFGFEYVRISAESMTFDSNIEFFRWKPTIFHLNPYFDQVVGEFLQCDQELALCTIVGHSYDLDVCNMWQDIEEIFARLSFNTNIISMCATDCSRYLNAMRQIHIDDDRLTNTSATKLYFNIDGRNVCLAPNETFAEKNLF